MRTNKTTTTHKSQANLSGVARQVQHGRATVEAVNSQTQNEHLGAVIVAH